jgi:hypothetical protein
MHYGVQKRKKTEEGKIRFEHPSLGRKQADIESNTPKILRLNTRFYKLL